MRVDSAHPDSLRYGASQGASPATRSLAALAILDCPPRFGWELVMDKLSLVPFQGQPSTLFLPTRGRKMGYTSMFDFQHCSSGGDSLIADNSSALELIFGVMVTLLPIHQQDDLNRCLIAFNAPSNTSSTSPIAFFLSFIKRNHPPFVSLPTPKPLLGALLITKSSLIETPN